MSEKHHGSKSVRGAFKRRRFKGSMERPKVSDARKVAKTK